MYTLSVGIRYNKSDYNYYTRLICIFVVGYFYLKKKKLHKLS